MFETLKNAFKVKEIRVKIYWTLLFLFIYRIGCYIPVPGIGTSLFGEGVSDNSYLNIMSMMTGGSLANGTLFAMGIGPYINASIIMQLLAVAIPPLERLSKQGEEGRKKIASYTRYLAVLLAILQSIGILVSYGGDGGVVQGQASLSAIISGGVANVNGFTNFLSYCIIILFYTAGTCVTMWIGERITDYGVSNGISLLIFAGIIASAGIFFGNQFQTVFAGGGFDRQAFLVLIVYVLVVVIVFAAIVFVDLAERKIKVQYAKQVKGRKMYGGQETVIPIKVNANGVMPLIFAFSILTFPELIMTLFGWQSALNWWQLWLGAGSPYPFYAIVLSLLIVFFAFFYSQIQFNPEDISKTIQQNGGFVPGIRPGKPTAEHLKKISNRLTLFGAIFLALLALIPTVILNLLNIPGGGAFNATGMLICVSVALEFNTALESQIMMKNYKGFLK